MVLIKRRDTTRRRHADGHRLYARLLVLAAGGPLYLHTIPLHYGDINNADDIQHAKKAAQTILEVHGSPPAWTKLESGRCGLLHLHIITPLAAIDAPRIDTRFIYHLRGLADYLTKPNDARLCKPRPKHLSRYTDAELRAQHIAALVAQDAAKRARNGKRSPPRSWTFRAGSEWQQDLYGMGWKYHGDTSPIDAPELSDEIKSQPAPRRLPFNLDFTRRQDARTSRPQRAARTAPSRPAPRARQRRVIAWRWTGDDIPDAPRGLHR